MFNFNHLYYFYLFAQMGSVSSAAKQLHISQPALSAQLKDLEANLGRKLSQKEGRNLGLTPDGRFVFEFCRQIFPPAEDLWAMLKTKDVQKSRRIHLGISTDVERPMIAEMISHFLRGRGVLRKPRVSLTSMNPNVILERLKEKYFDAIVVNAPVYDPEVEELGVVTMPVVLAYSRRLGQVPGQIEPSNLKGALTSLKAHWAVPAADMRLRMEIDRFLEKRKISPSIVFESDVLASVISAVAEGAGVSLLPRAYVDGRRVAGRISVFGPEEGFWQHSIWLFARRSDAGDSLLESLAESFLSARA